MVIECGGGRRGAATAPGQQEGEEEEEGISLGIPVCEALDLEAIQDSGSRASDVGRKALRPSTTLNEQVGTFSPVFQIRICMDPC